MDTEETRSRLHRIERELARLLRLVLEINAFLRSKPHPPTAPGLMLAGLFPFAPGDHMQAILVATIPTTRSDGSALAATDIASITFQKTSLTGTPPVPGPEVPLITNTAAADAGLTPGQITYTDTTSLTGDSYTCFVTDTLGNESQPSNAVTNQAAPPLAAPSAPSLAATFQ